MSGVVSPGTARAPLVAAVVAAVALALPAAPGGAENRVEADGSAPHPSAWPAPAVADTGEVGAAEMRDVPEDLAELRPVFEESPLEAVPRLLGGASARSDAAEENRWIDLARLLRGMDEDAAREAGLAAVEEEAGDPEAAVQRLEEALDRAGSDDSAAGLAALAARIADDAQELDGSVFRHRLVEEHLDSPDGPEAAVLLARSLIAQGSEGRQAAMELLEELVVSRPDHALVPDARRLIERLQGGGPG